MTKHIKKITEIIEEGLLDILPLKFSEGFPDGDIRAFFKMAEQLSQEINELNELDIFSEALNIMRGYLEQDESEVDNVKNNFFKLSKDNEENIKSDLVKFFTRFPKKYELIIHLPNVFFHKHDKIKIADNLEIEFINYNFSNKNIFADLTSFHTEWDELDSNSKKYYIRLKLNCTGYLTSNHVENHLSILKQLIVLCLTINLFTINSRNELTYHKPDPLVTALGRAANKKENVLTNFFYEIGDQDSTNKKHISLDKSLESFLYQLEINKDLSDAAARLDVLSRCCNTLMQHSANRKKDKTKKTIESEMVRVLNALEWSFNSKLQSNKTFKFMMNCIAIEAILNEPKDVTKTLQCKSAHQLAKTHEQRIEIYDKVGKLYELRSNLMHGTITKLEGGDLDLANYADSLLRDLIYSELDMIIKS